MNSSSSRLKDLQTSNNNSDVVKLATEVRKMKQTKQKSHHFNVSIKFFDDCVTVLHCDITFNYLHQIKV